MALVSKPTTINKFDKNFLNTYRASGMPTYGDKSSINNLLATSTNIVLKANNQPIGLVQSIQAQENRSINKLQEIGRLGVVQAVPGNTNGGSISTSRIAIYNNRLYSALQLTVPDGDSSLFTTLRQQEVPLEIIIESAPTVALGGLDSNVYVETYVDCWLSSFNKSISVGSITITESATIQYGDVL